MRTLESAEVCWTGYPLAGATVSPDVVATAEVLRSLYLPHECRHLVELLQLEAAASNCGAGTRAPGRTAPGEPTASVMNDEMFLDLIETRLADAATPMMQIRRMRDLRDVLQIQVWFLDALQDQLRQASIHHGGGASAGGRAMPGRGGGEFEPRRPVREELAELLRRERARYEPAPRGYPEPAVSRAIQEQLWDG
jgi:hypothetical protein